MPNWTSNTLVNNHLLNAFLGALQFQDEQVTLAGLTPSHLQNRLLATGTVLVKWCLCKIPEQEQKTLTGVVIQTLAHPLIVRGSVLVALHPILNQTYLENLDYIVDYEAGTIRRTSSSTIPSATSVYIWYLYFTPFVAFDYNLDEDAATITRDPGGDIPDGATVFVDYEVTAADIASALIDQAIQEAEDKILLRLSPNYTAASTDQGLTTGATELSLSIIMEALATFALQHESLSDPQGRAQEFRSLASKREADAWATLAPFTTISARAPTKQPNE